MPSAGDARSPLFLSESSMGVMEDTGFLNIIKYLQTSGEARRLRDLWLIRGHIPDHVSVHYRVYYSTFNFALAKRNLPAIIWCFVNRTRLASTYKG